MSNQFGRKPCISCGGEIDSNSLYCAHCGAKQEQEAPVIPTEELTPAEPLVPEKAETNAVPNAQQTMNEFWEQYASKQTKSWDKAVWILAFLSGALNLLVGLFLSIASLIDAAIFLFLGFKYKKQRSKKLALIITVICAICTLIGMAGGNVSGVVFLIAAVQSYLKLKKLEEAYARYQATGELPSAPI